MKKSAFVKKVLVNMPGFLNVDTFFYFNQFEHILNGFCCEITPRGAYLWRFVYPLFDKFECLNLLYSYRLPGTDGYISFDKTPREQLADEFYLRLADRLAEAKQSLTLPQFMSFFNKNPGLLRNSHAEMVLGYTIALLGKKEQALQHLRKAFDDLSEPYSSDCREISDLIEIDLDRARERILGFEVEMKKKLRISQ